MKKVIGLIIIMFFMITGVYAQSPIVGIEEGYDYLSRDIYQKALDLEAAYPEIIEVVEFGRSFDNKPLFALRMTRNVADYMGSEEANTERTHYYIDGGNHSRETVNPPIVLRMVEDYARDYYNNGYIKEFNLQQILNDSVLHFIPLPNPDGFDLVKQGLASVETTKGLNAIKSVGDTNYTNYKANLRGVDLNRNFPSVHFNLEKKQWEDIWGKYPSWLDRSEPGGEFYSGPYPASEVETVAIMDYLIRYDFRQYLTFHSRGNLTYWHKYFYTAPYNNQTRKFAEIINSVNGFTVAGLSSGRGSGYFSDYTAGMTYKPTVTVETTASGSVLPTIRSKYQRVYDNIRHLPLHLREEGEKTGYHDYKLYRDGVYVRDYLVKDYAYAVAEKYGGYIVQYSGAPKHIDPTLPEPEPEPEPDPVPDFPVEDYRIWGNDRYSTSAAIALKKYDRADTVILVRGDHNNDIPQVADALAASGLAGAKQAPILVSRQNRLMEDTKKAIRDLEAKNVIIVGGPLAVSSGIEQELQGLGLEVLRIQGDNRENTAAEVARTTLAIKPSDTVIIAGGDALVDSLVAGPLAHRDGHPILLIRNGLTEQTKSVIEDFGIENIIIVGGGAVVSEEIEGVLRSLVPGEVQRISGANRYDTSVAVSNQYFQDFDEILIVNGRSFVDAVAGSILEIPVIYTDQNRLRPSASGVLQQKRHFYVLGGKAVITDKVLIEAYEVLR